mmetsp:Transcript_76327/g.205192  ORF Transcript_76327/g.205192 Transcript_76327/m.205192 type:complete len:202 (+) Transcript_76327:4615-5220(+)
MTEDSIDGVGLARGRAVRVLVEKEVQWPLLIGKALLAVLRHRLRRNHLVHEAVDAVVGSLAPSVVPGHAVGAHARRLQIGLPFRIFHHLLLVTEGRPAPDEPYVQPRPPPTTALVPVGYAFPYQTGSGQGWGLGQRGPRRQAIGLQLHRELPAGRHQGCPHAKDPNLPGTPHCQQPRRQKLSSWRSPVWATEPSVTYDVHD